MAVSVTEHLPLTGAQIGMWGAALPLPNTLSQRGAQWKTGIIFHLVSKAVSSLEYTGYDK